MRLVPAESTRHKKYTSIWREMADDSLAIVAQVYAMYYALHKSNRVHARRYWVHPILRRRRQRGEFHGLVQELRFHGVLFEQYFRMTRENFDELLGKVGPLITKANTAMRLAIRPAERLAICLRYLATGDSYRTIAFSYRVGRSTVCGIIRDVARAIWSALVEETMPAPSTEDWREIAAGFQERWQFPNCIGAIDGKHVVLQAPANSGSLFFNYKSTYSLVLLAVVDADYLFRVVDVGGYGRSSDSGILRNSAFGEGLRDGTLSIPSEAIIPGAEERGPLPYVFVGDEGFPLMVNLLRPFPGRQVPLQRRVFNYRLSRARLVVECAFGILSARWRMYRRVIATSPEVAEACVKATCVLHNFLRIKSLEKERSRCTRREPEDSDDPDSAPPVAPIDHGPPESLRDAPRLGSNNASRRAIQLRETFCSYLNEEGAVSWQPTA